MVNIRCRFYRFILHFTEVAPHALENLPEPLFISIIECVRHGLNSDFGQEVKITFFFILLTNNFYKS